MLSNHVFEELAMDVYDEVDRRETDTIWNSVHMKVIETCTLKRLLTFRGKYFSLSPPKTGWNSFEILRIFGKVFLVLTQ